MKNDSAFLIVVTELSALAALVSLGACTDTPVAKQDNTNSSGTAPSRSLFRVKSGFDGDTRTVVVDQETGCEYIWVNGSISIRYGQNGQIMCPTRAIVHPDGTEEPY